MLWGLRKGEEGIKEFMWKGMGVYLEQHTEMFEYD